MEIKNRLQRLRQKFKEKEIEAIWVSQPDNLYYLSGCEGLEGYLLIAERNIIVTDFRYIEQARRQSPDYEIFPISGKMSDWLPGLLAGQNIRRLGFESNHLHFAAWKQMEDIFHKAQLPVKLIPIESLVDSLRMVKEPEEIDLISQAVKITDTVFEHIEKVLHAGMTEKALAWEIEKFIRENGSEPVPFEIIVASGPNAALPHARPSNYVIQELEPIVVDIGARHKFYTSDLTRTFYIGKMPGTFRQVYDTILDAQHTAISYIKSGMTGAQADAIARRVIGNAGFGEAFGHSLGHGIGLATHENPRLGFNSDDILANGMVFTIEPGIYLSGWGGVRLEDDVVMENDRLRVISSARKLM
jgi:Xaa-Pro aminopeptidase